MVMTNIIDSNNFQIFIQNDNKMPGKMTEFPSIDSQNYKMANIDTIDNYFNKQDLRFLCQNRQKKHVFMIIRKYQRFPTNSTIDISFFRR